MPLALMRNFEAPRDATDYYLMSGDLHVGRIYERQGTQRLEFLWALNGVSGGPHEMRGASMVATLGLSCVARELAVTATLIRAQMTACR